MPETVGTAPQTAPSAPQPTFTIIEPGIAARTLWLLKRAFIAAYEAARAVFTTERASSLFSG